MQPAFTAVAALVFLPFLAAAAVPLVYRLVGERTAYYAAAIALVCLGLVGSLFGTHGAVAVPWVPALGVELAFYVDGLALLFGVLATGIGVLILVYSYGYLSAEPGGPRYYAALLAFMGSMLGVVFAADLLVLFVFWELTSVSSFVLIAHYSDQRASLYAARKALVITVAGGLFMLVGFVLIHAAIGSYDLAAMLAEPRAVQAQLRSAGVFLPVLGLVAIGAAAKSAQVPLHIWLPNAMEAPTPVSAFLHSATMVKAGVYLVGRFRPLLAGEEWTVLFVTLGLLTMATAAVLAVAATDIKELLAYSTASHLGLIIAGFGLTATVGEAAAALGGEAGAFHVLNHALFKAALFLVAGIVAHEAGTRELADLGGLRRELPLTAGVAVIGSLSMAGVPPFNGFYSKELLFEATYDAAAHAGGAWWLLPVVATLASVFTVLYSLRFLMLFFGRRPAALDEIHRPPASMLVPAGVLAVLAAIVAVAPLPTAGAIVGGAVEGVGGSGEIHAALPTYLSPPVAMSAIAIGGGLVAYPTYPRLHRGLGRLLEIEPLRVDWYYNGFVDGLETASDRITPVVQTGLVRTYAGWALAATSGLALAGYAATGTALPAFGGFAAALPTALVLLVALGGAAATVRAPSHVAGVLTLSILGFMVAVFYVLASAPDLALTQLLVETLVLVIFLLVLNRLPAFYGEPHPFRVVRDAALALVVGATVAVTVLVSTAASPREGIAQFFLDRAGFPPGHHAGLVTDYGGGGNVVNVILVDFRAFDTLGEISVVGLAALSVLTLLAMRQRGEPQ